MVLIMFAQQMSARNWVKLECSTTSVHIFAAAAAPTDLLIMAFEEMFFSSVQDDVMT